MNLTETCESSCYNSNSNIRYEPCIWTRETCLSNINKKILSTNFPHGISDHGELILIGKTRSKLSSSNRITDQIGQVKKSLSKLEIVHSNKVYQLDSFVLLNFMNPLSYQWSNFDINFPSNALRIGYDTVSQSVLFLGRTIGKNVNLVGKISSSDYKLISSVKQEIKIFDSKFQVLCLRPSPEKLKILCRNLIRTFSKSNNLVIDKLKKSIKDPKLLEFIKYKNCLKSGQCLKRNECIQSANTKYRLFLDDIGNLKFIINEVDDYLFLYEKVECLWFNDLKLVVCFENKKSVNFLGSFSTNNAIYSDNSKLKLCNKGFLNLISSSDEFKIIIQLRYDLESYVNSKKPKYDFSYFYAPNEEYENISSCDENDDDDVESESNDESHSEESSKGDSDNESSTNTD
ncbi:unnamed protein product [Brachionus calyciflorus]|uniref:Uncharacterized protein n=1 Tax=Brachionus calyciflorus TaxID=104777 RepID=A0A813MUZ7_9BILA|nr:unnamed protein product [Brachionus calyciflorus]